LLAAVDIHQVQVTAGLNAIWQDVQQRPTIAGNVVSSAAAFTSDKIGTSRTDSTTGAPTVEPAEVDAASISQAQAQRSPGALNDAGTNQKAAATRGAPAADNGAAPQARALAPDNTTAGRQNNAAQAIASAEGGIVVQADPETPTTADAEDARGQAANNSASSAIANLPDTTLLQRFVTNRDQEAFTSLVQRHQPAVLGICQRVLGDSHAAEDAAQSTFVVLARHAGLLDGRAPLAAWLARVAYHLALRIRAIAARRRKLEKSDANGRPPQIATESSAELERQEIHRALHEELQRLPEKYRATLVLCYLDGRTHVEAAQQIGLPRGSMAKRIGQALDVLRERLIARGLIP